MASTYRHLTGDSDKGSQDYKVLHARGRMSARTVKLFLLSNTGSSDASVDIYLKKPIITVTKRDANNKPIETEDHSEVYYVLKNISIPTGASYNVLEGLGNFEYNTYLSLHVNVIGNATTTLDLILNYE